MPPLSELGYRFEPHGHIAAAVHGVHHGSSGCGGEGVPGVGRDGVWLGGYLGGLYRVPTQYPPGTIFSPKLASGPYLRPNEGEYTIFNEVSQDGPQIDPQMTLRSPSD